MPMNRQRTLPPSFFEDEDLNELPIPIRHTAFLLHWVADDEGRASAKATRLKADMYVEDDEMTLDEIDDHLLALAEIGYLFLYTVNDRSYLALTRLSIIQRPTASRFPAPPESFRNGSGAAPGRGGRGEGEERRESEGREEWAESGAHSGIPHDDTLPPSPFCRKHQPNGTETRCRNCGTARLAHDHWHSTHLDSTGPVFVDTAQGR